jgi:multidrug efflux pump subunit AcrA (membrane-fusion protein)
VYATSGDRNAQQPIQEGGQVRERQMLFRLPDTASMKTVVRIQESQIGRLKEGMRAIVRLPLGLPTGQATVTKISVLADNAQRWWNPDLKEYPVELTLDVTPPGLKPGMNATAEIFVDRLQDVLAVPLTAVYAAGQDTFVFTPDADGGAKPIKVTLGQSNETHVEVKGVEAGIAVLTLQSGQGRELLEKAGIKPTPVKSDAPDAKGPGKRRKKPDDPARVAPPSAAREHS